MIDQREFEIYFCPSKLLRKYWHIAMFNPLKKTMGYIKYEEIPDKKSKTKSLKDHLVVDGFHFDIVWMNGYGTFENCIDRVFDVVGDYHLPRRTDNGFLRLYTREEARRFKPEKMLVSYNTGYYPNDKFLTVQNGLHIIKKRIPDECKLTVDRWVNRNVEYYEPYRVKLFHQRAYKAIKLSWREFEARPDLRFNLIDTIDLNILVTMAYWVQMLEELETAKKEGVIIS